MYETIKNLCIRKGVTVTKMCKEIGISPTIMSGLNTGKTKNLSAPTLQKIASYLGVTPNDLMNGTATEKNQSVTNGDELIEILETCKERSDLRVLFKLSKDASAEDVKKAIAIIEALRNA